MHRCRRTILLAGVLVAAAATRADAAVPDRIVSLLGPSVGYLLSQSDLCQWGLGDRIRKAYDDGFAAIGMTQAQRSSAWDQASATQRRLAEVPAEAREHMKADTCTSAARERVERDLRD
jgi:hypothetical protein